MATPPKPFEYKVSDNKTLTALYYFDYVNSTPESGKVDLIIVPNDPSIKNAGKIIIPVSNRMMENEEEIELMLKAELSSFYMDRRISN